MPTDATTIDSLSGDALDAAIALEVMGWVVDSGNKVHWVAPADRSFRAWKGRWSPSTDHNAMAEVLARIPDVSMWRHDGTWCCDPNDGSTHGEVYGESPTMPIAVCRAALAWARKGQGL